MEPSMHASMAAARLLNAEGRRRKAVAERGDDPVDGEQIQDVQAQKAAAIREYFQALLLESHSTLSRLFLEFEDRLIQIVNEEPGSAAGPAVVRNQLKAAGQTCSSSAYQLSRGYSFAEAALQVDAAGNADAAAALAQRDRTNMLTFDPAQPGEGLDAIDEHLYSVEKYYKTTGWAQQIARSSAFSSFTLGAIALNAIYLGYDTNSNTADILAEAAMGYIICENLFCFVFTVEIIIRLSAFKHKFDCLKDNWFKFDSVLMCLMILETWVVLFADVVGLKLSALPTAPFRLLRLMRLSRLVRVVRTMPELVTIIRGIWTASRAVICTVLMVLCLVYTFSIIMLMSCAPLAMEHQELYEYFGTLSLCMWTLMVDGTFMSDVGTPLKLLRETGSWEGVIAIVVFILFILLSAYTVLNMLIGILCEVVAAVGQHERNEADIRLVKRGILQELLEFDEDGDGTISKTELETVMRSSKARQILDGLGVDVAALDEMHGMLFKDPLSKVAIKQVLEICLNYRGSQLPTVRHLVDSMWFSRYFLEKTIRDSTQEIHRTVMRECGLVIRAVADVQAPSFSPAPSVADVRAQVLNSAGLYREMPESQVASRNHSRETGVSVQSPLPSVRSFSRERRGDYGEALYPQGRAVPNDSVTVVFNDIDTMLSARSSQYSGFTDVSAMALVADFRMQQSRLETMCESLATVVTQLRELSDTKCVEPSETPSREKLARIHSGNDVSVIRGAHMSPAESDAANLSHHRKELKELRESRGDLLRACSELQQGLNQLTAERRQNEQDLRHHQKERREVVRASQLARRRAGESKQELGSVVGLRHESKKRECCGPFVSAEGAR